MIDQNTVLELAKEAGFENWIAGHGPSNEEWLLAFATLLQQRMEKESAEPEKITPLPAPLQRRLQLPLVALP
jgi:hypothetical protein